MAQAAKQQGNDAYRVGNYDVAIRFYSQSIEADPTDYTVWSNRAAAYSSLSPPLWDKSLADANEVVKLCPEWPKGWFRKGVAHRGLQQWEHAIEALTNALAKTPGTDPTIQELLASSRALQRQHYGSHRSETVTDPEECKKLGNALFRDSNYADAAAFYTRAIELSAGREDPAVAVYYVNRAACHAQTHSYNEVIEDSTAALRYDPENTKAYLRRAFAYEGLEKWALAAADYRRAMELAPGSKPAGQGYDRCQKLANA